MCWFIDSSGRWCRISHQNCQFVPDLSSHNQNFTLEKRRNWKFICIKKSNKITEQTSFELAWKFWYFIVLASSDLSPPSSNFTFRERESVKLSRLAISNRSSNYGFLEIAQWKWSRISFQKDSSFYFLRKCCFFLAELSFETKFYMVLQA